MCEGNYQKDPEFAASNRGIRYVRGKASYFLRGRYRRIGGKNCVYYGFKADTGDHVPSLFAGYTNGVVNGVVVSSCYDCNKYLGPFSSTCLKERAAFLASVYDDERDRNELFASNPKAGPQWREKADAFRLKAARCKERMNAMNCNMLEGAAALFAKNGESGGETTSYDSIGRLHSSSEPRTPEGLSFEETRSKADQGDASAQARLGHIYLVGPTGKYRDFPVQRDEQDAAKWFRLAADNGELEAQFWLGEMYLSGMGVPQDLSESVRWYRKAAEQGDAEAQHRMARFYWRGGASGFGAGVRLVPRRRRAC